MTTLTPNGNSELNLTDRVLAKLPTPILVVDDEGRYTFANEAACDLLGRTLPEILGLQVSDIAGDSYDTESSWDTFTGEGRLCGEFPVRRPDGTIVPVQFSAGYGVEPGRHVSVLVDISERKRIEAQLRRNEELFLRAFIASPVPSTISKLESGAFIELNEAFTNATGCFRGEVIGRSARAIGLWKDSKVVEALLTRLRNGEAGVATRAELRTADKDIREFFVSMKRADIHSEAHVVTTYTDLVALQAEG